MKKGSAQRKSTGEVWAHGWIFQVVSIKLQQVTFIWLASPERCPHRHWTGPGPGATTRGWGSFSSYSTSLASRVHFSIRPTFPSLFLPRAHWQADLTSGPSAFKHIKEEKAKKGGGGCSRDHWGREWWRGCPCWGRSPVPELRDKVGNFYLALPIRPCWSCACFRLDVESSLCKQLFFLSFSFPLWALKDNQPPLFSEGAANAGVYLPNFSFSYVGWWWCYSA